MKRPRLNVIGAVLLALLGLTGCADTGPTYELAAQSKFVNANHQAIDKLIASLRHSIPQDQPLLVATVVSVDSMTETARLGRTLSEQYTSRLTQLGYPVIEAKLRGSLFVREGKGEFLLSREIKEISARHKASFVLVGTYSPAKDYVYINIKLIEAREGNFGLMVGGHDYALPVNRSIAAMIDVTR